MSSKFTKLSIALLLSVVSTTSVFASLTAEEEAAIRTGTPVAVKKLASDMVNTATPSGIASTIDAYEQRLGGSEEDLKDALGIGGFTTILEDINTLKGQVGGAADITARIGRNPTSTNLPDINAAIITVDATGGSNTLTLMQARNNVQAAIDATPSLVGDLFTIANDQNARIGVGVGIAASLNTTVQTLGVTAPNPLANINAELAAERTALLAWINGTPANLAAVHLYAPADPADALVFTGPQPIDLVDAAVAANTIHKLILAGRTAINL